MEENRLISDLVAFKANGDYAVSSDDHMQQALRLPRTVIRHPWAARHDPRTP